MIRSPISARPGTVALFILLAGGALAVGTYNSLQYGTVTTMTSLTDTQKKILESSESLSNWLLGIAYSCLAGVTVLLVKRDLPVRRESRMPFAAAAFLILSLLGRFLFYDALIFSLSEGGFQFFTGKLGRFPILLQFYGLALGLVCLGIWLYPRMTAADDKPNILNLSLILILVPCSVLRAQPATGSCVSRWESARGLQLGSARSSAEKAIAAIRMKSGARSQLGDCDLDFALLDQVRVASSLSHLPGDATALPESFKSLEDQLSSVGFSTDGLAGRLVDLADIFRSAHSKLIVTSLQKHTYTVLIDGGVGGLTNFDTFVKPGKHTIKAALDGRPVFQTEVEVKNGEERKIEVRSQ
jgi:hypothetical protein